MEPAVYINDTYKSFYSKDHTNPAYQPRLVITYETWTNVQDVTFKPVWQDGTVNVGLEIQVPYQEHRYLWSDSPDQPTSGWSAWSAETAPVCSYAGTSPKFLHVEARDSLDNVTWRVSRPYTGDNPYGDKIVWFDDVQLEEGSRVSALNMLANSSFNALLNGKPEGYMFSTGNTAVDTVVSKDHRNGQNSVKITSAGGEAFLFLHQQVILQPNTDYTVSFWIKGEGLEKTGDSICLAQGDNKSLAPLFTYTTEEDEFDWRLNPLDLKLDKMKMKQFMRLSERDRRINLDAKSPNPRGVRISNSG